MEGQWVLLVDAGSQENSCLWSLFFGRMFLPCNICTCVEYSTQSHWVPYGGGRARAAERGMGRVALESKLFRPTLEWIEDEQRK